MISDRPTRSHKIPQIPLRLVLIVPFVLQIVGAVGIVGYSSYRNGQEAVNNIADRMMDQTAKRISDHRVEERTDELMIANRQLESLVNLDGLTQIANRRRFDNYLAIEWQRHQREQNPLALILMDIDYFKRYNDSYGHQGGDDCLIQVAQAIAQVPKRPSDLTARYGGEEFVMVLCNTDTEGALKIAAEVQTAIADLAIPHETYVNNYVTLSMGVASLIPISGQNPESLISYADKALYTAKDQGRNRAIAHI